MFVSVQVVASFEGGLKKFRSADGKRKSPTTTELVHDALLLPGACVCVCGR
jgi:hypothetical protein